MAANDARQDVYPGPRENPDERTFLGGSSLGARFGWLFVCALIALGGAGAALYVADRQADRTLGELAAAIGIGQHVTKVENAVQSLRSNSRAYLSTQDARFVGAYGNDADALGKELKALLDDPAAVDAEKLVTTLNDGLGQHTEHFQNAVRIVGLLGAGPDDGLIGNARTSGAALEQRVAEVGSNELARRVDVLRRVEDALVSGAAAPGNRTLSEEVAEFRRAITESDIPQPAKADIDQRADAYAADIGQLARTRAALSNTIARIDEVNAYMEPSLDSLVSFGANLVGTARTNVAATQWELRYVVAGAAGGAIVFLLLASLVLLRSVTHPLRRVSRAAAQIAQGNQAVSIPVLGNADDTGTVALALTYFRENLIQAERLRNELELHLQRDAAQEEESYDMPEEEAAAGTAEEPAHYGRGRALVPTARDEQSGTQISNISRALAETSRAASSAAGEAERTETMVKGLADAIQRIDDIESLLGSISDQLSLLTVQTALSDETGDDRENLVLLAEKRQGEGGHRASGQSVADRIETIQSGTKRAIKNVQQIGRTLSDVNEVAVGFAETASTEALDAATELLRQSEDLRGMLDDLLTKVRAEGSAIPDYSRGNRSRDSEG